MGTGEPRGAPLLAAHPVPVLLPAPFPNAAPLPPRPLQTTLSPATTRKDAEHFELPMK